MSETTKVTTPVATPATPAQPKKPEKPPVYKSLTEGLKVPDGVADICLSVAIKDGSPVLYLGASYKGMFKVLNQPIVPGQEINLRKQAQHLLERMAS